MEDLFIEQMARIFLEQVTGKQYTKEKKADIQRIESMLKPELIKKKKATKAKNS